MDTVMKAIEMIKQRYEEENGEEFHLEEGDEIAGVFNDGIVILGVEDKKVEIKVLAGEPYVFNYNLDLLEE